MDQSRPVGGRCELTPPIDAPIIGSRNKRGAGCDVNSLASKFLSKPRGFDHITQSPTSINLESAHAITHDSVVACDRPLRASVEGGAEKLHSQQIPLAGSPIHTPVTHAVETSKEIPNIGHPLITPPPSSTPIDVHPVKAYVPTSSRNPVTRNRTTSRKRNLRKGISDEEKLMKNLSKKTCSFAEREVCWSNAAADSDFLLALPQPNHVYVDGRKRLKINDSRFVPFGIKSNNAPYCLTAGIPSKKPYTPYYPPAFISFATLGSPKDSGLNETATDTPQEEAFHARPSVKLIIPDVIKALLVDDWENVTKNTQLVPLPHSKPVTKILEDYSAYEMPKRPAGSSHADILEETLSGLKEYFDKSLGRILLYKFERPQYAEIYKKCNSTDPEFQGKTTSDIYGAEHLCRLIVSLPELIAQTNMDQQSVNRLREELAKFCTWLSKNSSEYFTNSYETPAQDYVDKAKN